MSGDEITIRVMDYLPDFTKAIFDSLTEGEVKYGNLWLRLPREGQEERIIDNFDDKYANWFHGKPIDWASIAGNAMIAWIRENYPDDLEEWNG